MDELVYKEEDNMEDTDISGSDVTSEEVIPEERQSKDERNSIGRS